MKTFQIGKKGLRLSWNAPVTLSFVAVCAIAQVLNFLTGGASNRALFSVYASSLLDPLTYLRLVLHVFGHSGWEHLMNNAMYLLILGPMLEEKYGTKNMALVILITAVVTGLLNMILFPDIRLLGASGVVFAMILLSSITSAEDGSIPVTFLLVVLLYIGQQIFEGLTMDDQISQFTHIAGGAVGSVLGFVMNRKGTGTKTHSL
ncbi:MAG: rhomboid family intramembrane serine protease [Clostridia bacterium]|nr:rhomboid family intramembrane serine protease [Clostridia bacterium]